MIMKTFSKVAIGILFLGIAASSAAEGDFTEISYAEAKGWQLDWSDEFNGKDVDENKWEWEQNCWGGGNNELQCYTDRYKNSFIEDGKLVIRAHKETFRGPAEPEDTNARAGKKTLPYTSARMRTKNKGDWTFGRIEVRAKLPAGQGLWPAIWMLPTDFKYGTWAASGEIDIIEMVSQNPDDPNKHVHGTLHYGQSWPKNVYSGETFIFEDSDPSKDFHTYAIEWADGEIRWYIDEKHYATQFGSGWYSQIRDENGDFYNVEGNAPFNERFHLLLNLAVGGNWPGEPDETVKFPVQMEVDYVRVYSCPGAKSSLRTCATKDRRATRNFGKQPPDLATLNIKYDKDFWKAEVVDIFNGESVPPFTASAWTGHGAIDVSVVEDSERGMVQQFKFNTDQGVGYWQGPLGFDFSDFKFIEFDLLRLADPRNTDGMFMKIDCFHPCSSGEVPMESSPLGEWKSYRMSLKDIGKNPGSSLNLSNVNTPLVIMPTWDNQQGVILRLDNVRFVRK
jgi:beta-glucanase (GH16 family)